MCPYAKEGLDLPGAGRGRKELEPQECRGLWPFGLLVCRLWGECVVSSPDFVAHRYGSPRTLTRALVIVLASRGTLGGIQGSEVSKPLPTSIRATPCSEGT
jgi:hypothetical protein